LLLAVCVAGFSDAGACTIFMGTTCDLTLVGNNEDWSDPDTKVWFLVPEEGKYGRIYFGFKNGWAQGGMNDQELFFDWVAGFNRDWKADPDKKNHLGNISEKVLEEAATVEDALEILADHNVRHFARAKIMLVDRTGCSAIVGFENGRLRIDLAAGDFQCLGYGESVAGRTLAKPGAVSVDTFRKLARATLQTGKFSTKYSNVYDLTNGEVHVYRFHDGKEPVTFNLAQELAKGNHYYDIPLLDEQLKRPPAVDGKTYPVVEIDHDTIAGYAGTYRINETDKFEVFVEGNRLYGRVTTKQGQGNKNEYRAASDVKFFLPWYDQQITFTRGESGAAPKILIESFDGSADEAVRVE
jgi:hypothetical protein